MNEKSHVFCAHHKKQMPALKSAPLMGPIGLILKNHVCAEAWEDWIEAQMKIINEERLDLSEARAQAYLFEKMVDYLGIQDHVEI